MRIKNIKLHNIRSYKTEEVSFEEGSTLLSGNIGSGKSTILLALDFVLFGISRDLPGSALLRKGETEGSVELHCVINDNEIIIKRGLKRTPTSVGQETGFIIKNDEKKELTAMELKQEVLTLLNYPQELLTKSKSMVYHYTVYSPQERMKDILLSKREERLEILRRVFGIDKYKRVQNNTDIFLTALKQKSKEIAASIADLEQKKEALAENKEKEQETKTFLTSLEPKILTLQNKIAEKKKFIDEQEKQQQVHQQKKHEREKLLLGITHKKSEIVRLQEEETRIKKEIVDITLSLEKLPLADPSLQERITILDTEIQQGESQVTAIERKVIEFTTVKKSKETVCNDINALDVCPTCKQTVDADHKKHITSNESKEIEKVDRELQALQRDQEYQRQTLLGKKEERKKKQEQLNAQQVVQIKDQEKKQKELQVQSIIKQKGEAEQSLLGDNQRISQVEQELQRFPESTTELQGYKQERDVITQELKEVELQRAGKEAECKGFASMILSLEEEITRKKVGKENIAKLLQLREWLEKQFMSMMALMEKNLLLRVHGELEELIKKWFGMLVDEETMKIRLDDEFTPIIEQNEHEIEYAHLSGGEKTAAALSYRLALNQVINTLMSGINTRNILMLDEPTDGFSQEQLERMRNILEELNTKQTIIVSHDPKVESFVDRVVRLEKKEHQTVVTKTI